MRRSSRSASLVTAAVSAVLALATGALVPVVVAPTATAAARDSGPITSPGPLTSIATSSTLRCQVHYNGVKQFYGTDSCVSSVASSGTVMGRVTAWTPVSQVRTGSGTRDDPSVLTTTVRGGGWEVTQVDSYVSGKGDYDTTLSVRNTEATARAAVVSHAADCYLQGGDTGYGRGDTGTGAVTCLKNPPSAADPGQVESFIPRTPGSTFGYGNYGSVWGAVDRGEDFGNRMFTSGSTSVDNGMGISWSRTIPAGGTQVFAWQNHFLTGEDPGAEVSLRGVLDDADGDGHADAGESVRFTASVENTGDVPLLSGLVTDAQGGASACPSPIAPGTSVDCTAAAPVVLTQEDVDRGAVTGSAVFTATTPRGAAYTASEARAEMTIVPVAAGRTRTGAVGDATAAGDTVDVVVTVENTGNVTLDDVVATADGVSTSCPTGPLAPGAARDCTIEHEVTQAEFDAGRLVFHGAATAHDPTGATVALAGSDGAVEFERRGAITATLTPVVADGAPAVGESIRLRLAVANSGNVSIRDLAPTVDDPAFGVVCPDGALAPGAAVDCAVTGAHRVTQDDVDAGSVAFAATVTAVDTAGVPVSAETNTSQDTVDWAPATTTTLVPVLDLEGEVPAAGDVVALTIRVTNTGNVTVHDAAAAVEDRPALAVTCPEGAVAPGTSVECTLPDHQLSQDDVDAGSVTFRATTTAIGPGDRPVESTDTAAVTLERRPALVATAAGTLTDTTRPPHAGDHVDLHVTARNTGNTTLRGLSATVDGEDLGVVCAEGALAPGAEAACAFDDHVLSQSEIDAGRLAFDVAVTADEPGGTPTTAEDSTSVELARVPAIEASATSVLDANEHEVPLAGDTAVLGATIRNTGNITVTGIRAEVLGHGRLTVDCPSDQLAPGESVSCRAPGYRLTQGDVDAGTVHFDLEVEATGVDRAGVEAAASTELSVVRAAAVTAEASSTVQHDQDAPVAAGDRVAVTLSVGNAGNVTLHDLRAAVDDRPDMVVTCPTASLAPGRSVDCAAEYSLAQTDVDAAGIAFDLTATAVGADGSTATATATTSSAIASAPSVDATVVAHLAATAGDTPRAGDRIVIGVRVTNRGNVTVSDPVAEVVDLPDASVSCPAGPLAPGSHADCTVPDHVLTQSDIDRGVVVITAVTDATTPSGGQVSDRDEVRVGLAAASALDLTVVPMLQDGDELRALEDGRPLRPGDSLRMRYTVVNTGNTTVHALQSVAGTQAADFAQQVLRPGERTTATSTAAHRITEAEGAAGSVESVSQVKGRVSRADGDAAAAETSSVAQSSAPLATRSAATPLRSVQEPVWVFSSEVRTRITADSAPIVVPPALAFTGAAGVQVMVAGAVLALLVGMLILVVRRREHNGAGDRHRP